MSDAAAETRTENLFRAFYGPRTFIEKSAIPSSCGFTSKSKTTTGRPGYPDFFLDETEFTFIVEAKATDHAAAMSEVRHYLENNRLSKHLVGIAVSGQSEADLRASFFVKRRDKTTVEAMDGLAHLVSLDDLRKAARRHIYGPALSDDELRNELKQINEKFHLGNRVRDTERSMFFSGLMIALKDDSFRATYANILPPSGAGTGHGVVIEAGNLNEAILKAIESQLSAKVNSRSKQINWQDRFAFIRTIDFPLGEYIDIIKRIEKNIFGPYLNDEGLDVLGRAYKIFLSRAGQMDNKNIILTPDHIKRLMVELARLGHGDVVLDTCTGTGGFLMEAMEILVKLAAGNAETIRKVKEERLIGFEIDPVLFALACSNMFLHGDGRSMLLFRSSLLDMTKADDVDLFGYVRSLKPTKCIINPPYEGSFPIDFTRQALDYLEPGGSLVIIMPTMTLTKHTAATAEILKTTRLDYIITMPDRLFAEQGRTVNTAIFGFTKTPHRPADEVLFYDLADDGFVSIQHKGRVDVGGKWTGIKASVVANVGNGKEIEGVSEKRRIFDDNGVLRPDGYLPERKDAIHEQVRIGDLFDIADGSLPSGKADDTGDIPFITASEDWKRHTEATHDTEAIVMAIQAGGSLGRTHYVSGKFVASNLCLVLTAKADPSHPISLEFYNLYLTSIRERIAGLASGTSKKTIDPKRLADYKIDYIALDEQNAFVEQKARRIAALREDLRAAEDDMAAGLKAIRTGKAA